MSTIAATNSLFEIDVELDSLLDEIEEQTAQGGEPAGELVARFQGFCSAHDEKVDRIGRFLRRMEAREQFCRGEAARLVTGPAPPPAKWSEPETWSSTT